MKHRLSSLRQIFTAPAGGETLRAFLVFGVLLLVLLATAAQLAFREISLQVLTNRLDLVREEATTIARAVAAIGREAGGIDFSKLRANEDRVRNLIHKRLARRYIIRHVEIRDRFGVRQFFVSRETVARQPARSFSETVPVDWPSAGTQVVRVPLGRSEGEVRVGLSSEPVLDELKQMRHSLRVKVAVATALTVAVLVTGFFYILYLLSKNRRLEQARESAARASYVGLLASGLAHEIRNPLNAMSMNLQMLEEELLGVRAVDATDYGELLDSTKSEIKRLEQLVNNFLAYARPARPRFEPTDLNRLVEEVLRFLEADFRQSKVELQKDLEPLLPTVELDRTQFRQALINLLVNARQVLDEGGTVSLRTRPGSKGEAVLEIVDDGPGIPTEMRERIFEVFYSSRGGGTGLGLPIARQIVDRHGGTIELESEQGQGTTFRIRLPRRQDAEGPLRPTPQAQTQ